MPRLTIVEGHLSCTRLFRTSALCPSARLMVRVASVIRDDFAQDPHKDYPEHNVPRESRSAAIDAPPARSKCVLAMFDPYHGCCADSYLKHTLFCLSRVSGWSCYIPRASTSDVNEWYRSVAADGRSWRGGKGRARGPSVPSTKMEDAEREDVGTSAGSGAGVPRVVSVGWWSERTLAGVLSTGALAFMDTAAAAARGLDLLGEESTTTAFPRMSASGAVGWTESSSAPRPKPPVLGPRCTVWFAGDGRRAAVCWPGSGSGGGRWRGGPGDMSRRGGGGAAIGLLSLASAEEIVDGRIGRGLLSEALALAVKYDHSSPISSRRHRSAPMTLKCTFAMKRYRVNAVTVVLLSSLLFFARAISVAVIAWCYMRHAPLSFNCSVAIILLPSLLMTSLHISDSSSSSIAAGALCTVMNAKCIFDAFSMACRIPHASCCVAGCPAPGRWLRLSLNSTSWFPVLSSTLTYGILAMRHRSHAA